MREMMDMIMAYLEKELKLYRELLEVVEQERDALLGGRHDQLLEVNERKISVCNQLAQAQKERREIMVRLSPHPQRSLKLSELSELLPVAERSPYKALVRNLRGISERLSQLSEMNKGFLEEALDTVEHLMDILMGRNQQTAYTRKGMVQPRGMPRFMAREA